MNQLNQGLIEDNYWLSPAIPCDYPEKLLHIERLLQDTGSLDCDPVSVIIPCSDDENWNAVKNFRLGSLQLDQKSGTIHHRHLEI